MFGDTIRSSSIFTLQQRVWHEYCSTTLQHFCPHLRSSGTVTSLKYVAHAMRTMYPERGITPSIKAQGSAWALQQFASYMVQYRLHCIMSYVAERKSEPTFEPGYCIDSRLRPPLCNRIGNIIAGKSCGRIASVSSSFESRDTFCRQRMRG